MKALVLHELSESSSEHSTPQTLAHIPSHGKRFRVSIDDVPKPTLNRGEVLVRMSAAALNHRDEWIRQGQYARIKPGVILGSDGCGIVEEVSSKVDEHLLGKEIVINPSFNWGSDPRVQDRNYTILGLPINGTFAEYCAIPAQNCFPKPEHLRAVEAAAVPLAGLTAYRAFFTQGEASRDSVVLVTGIGGGVAQFAAQIGVAIGASVYATSSDDTKLATAIERIGLEGGANYTVPDWHKTLLEKAGEFNCVIDGSVGNNLDTLLAIMARGGRYVCYGATAGRPPSLNMQMIFWKQLRLVGTTMGTDREFEEMLDYLGEHNIIPIIDSVRPFDEIGTAFEVMSTGKQFGKLVVTFANHA